MKLTRSKSKNNPWSISIELNLRFTSSGFKTNTIVNQVSSIDGMAVCVRRLHLGVVIITYICSVDWPYRGQNWCQSRTLSSKQEVFQPALTFNPVYKWTGKELTKIEGVK